MGVEPGKEREVRAPSGAQNSERGDLTWINPNSKHSSHIVQGALRLSRDSTGGLFSGKTE